MRAQRAEPVERRSHPFTCDPALQVQIDEFYARLRPLNERRQAEVEAYDREIERLGEKVAEIDAALAELDRIAAVQRVRAQRQRELMAKLGG